MVEDVPQRLLQYRLLQKHHVARRGESRQIAFPAGITLLVKVPDQEAQRAAIQRVGPHTYACLLQDAVDGLAFERRDARRTARTRDDGTLVDRQGDATAEDRKQDRACEPLHCSQVLRPPGAVRSAVVSPFCGAVAGSRPILSYSAMTCAPSSRRMAPISTESSARIAVVSDP